MCARNEIYVYTTMYIYVHDVCVHIMKYMRNEIYEIYARNEIYAYTDHRPHDEHRTLCHVYV